LRRGEGAFDAWAFFQQLARQAAVGERIVNHEYLGHETPPFGCGDRRRRGLELICVPCCILPSTAVASTKIDVALRLRRPSRDCDRDPCATGGKTRTPPAGFSQIRVFRYFSHLICELYSTKGDFCPISPGVAKLPRGAPHGLQRRKSPLR